jgi:hypothetical protein
MDSCCCEYITFSVFAFPCSVEKKGILLKTAVTYKHSVTPEIALASNQSFFMMRHATAAFTLFFASE